MFIPTTTLTQGGVSGPGAWTAYSPSLTAVTTPPTMGAGATQVGSWASIGTLVVAQIQIHFGTGAAAGSGIYSIDVPIAGAPGDPNYGVIGSGMLYDNNANIREVVACGWFDASRTEMVMFPSNSSNEVANSIPWTWADSDVMRLMLQYESA